MFKRKNYSKVRKTRLLPYLHVPRLLGVLGDGGRRRVDVDPAQVDRAEVPVLLPLPLPPLEEVEEDVVGDGALQPRVDVLPGLSRPLRGRHGGRVRLVEVGQVLVHQRLEQLVVCTKKKRGQHFHSATLYQGLVNFCFFFP